MDCHSCLLVAVFIYHFVCFVRARYHYPFLGTTTPFVSQPWTTVKPNTKVTVEGGFFSYNFAASSEMVETAFKEVPLAVEIICSSRSREQLLATAEVQLDSILGCRSSTFVVGCFSFFLSHLPGTITKGAEVWSWMCEHLEWSLTPSLILMGWLWTFPVWCLFVRLASDRNSKMITTWCHVNEYWVSLITKTVTDLKSSDF